MKRTTAFFMILALAAGFTACTLSAPEEISGSVALKVRAGTATRTSGDAGIYWDRDTIGVMVDSVRSAEKVPDVSSTMDTYYRNVPYVAQNAADDNATSTSFEPMSASPVTGVWFDTESTVYVSAYAPYSATDKISTLPGDGGLISVSTRTANQNYYHSLDYLYAPDVSATRSDPKANFTFSHVMAQIVLDVVPDDDSTRESEMDVTDYRLQGLVLSGTFDVTTGEVLPDNIARDALPGIGLDSLTTVTSVSGTNWGKRYILLVCPQTAILSFTTDGGTTSKSNAYETYFHGGRSYHFTAYVSDDDIEIEGGDIYPWEDHTDKPYSLTSGKVYVDECFTITFTNGSDISLGTTGLIQIYDENNTRVDHIDLADVAAGFSSFTANPDYNTSMNILTGDPVGSSGPSYRVMWYTPVWVSGNKVCIQPHNNVLDFGKKYHITVDAEAVIADGFEGITGSEWTFTTRPEPSDAFNLKVGKEGVSVDFRTIQRAIYYGSANETDTNKEETPLTINVANGTYNETLYLRGKSNVTITGESRDGVIVRENAGGNLYGGQGGGSTSNPSDPETASGSIQGDYGGYFVFVLDGGPTGIRLENLTFENTYMDSRDHAGTIYFNSGSGNLAVVNCHLIGQYSAVDMKGYSWFHNCTIDGAQDLFWGQARTCLIEDCTLNVLDDGLSVSGTRSIIQCDNRNSGDHGIVLLNSSVTADNGISNLYLARIYGSSSFGNAAYINTSLPNSSLASVGWDSTTHTPVFHTSSELNGADDIPDATHGWKYYAGSQTSPDMSGWAMTGTSYTYCYVFTATEASDTAFPYKDRATILGEGTWYDN